MSDKGTQLNQWKKVRHKHCEDKRYCSYKGCVCPCYKCSTVNCESYGHEYQIKHYESKMLNYDYKICVMCGKKIKLT